MEGEQEGRLDSRAQRRRGQSSEETASMAVLRLKRGEKGR